MTPLHIIVEPRTKNHKQAKKKSRRRKTTIYKWLRDRTSFIDFGKKWKGHPIHCNKNEDVLEAFRYRRWLSRMTNAKYNQHFSGQETYYFAGTGSTKSKETLVMIDIDCHGTGTLDGAIQFADHLKEHHFPNLYYEVSTNGNGVHGYIVVAKADLGAEFMNQLLRRLDHHLKTILCSTNFAVENVEIKGTCPVMIWGEQQGELTNYVSGQLAKLPREAHRFEELKATTRLDYLDVMKLPIRERKRNSDIYVAPKSRGEQDGSISGKVISQEELRELAGHYGHVANLLMETHGLATTGRAVATVEDVAVFLMLLRFFTKHMNLDGSLPYARFEGLWSALYESGDINRPFDCKRFAAIRNYLSSLSLLDWDDENYKFGWTDEHGQYHRGKACRWRASNLLMDLLDHGKAKQKIAVTHTLEERGGEGASLAGTDIFNVIQSLVRAPEVVRPIRLETVLLWRVTAEDISRSISFFEPDVLLAA